MAMAIKDAQQATRLPRPPPSNPTRST